MATVSGVPVSNISKISSIDATTIVKISSIATANIPGWPSSGPSCTTVYWGYSDGRRTPPSAACTASPSNYELGDDGKLYLSGDCGGQLAAAGFYGTGRELLFWDLNTLTSQGPCGP